MKCLILFSGKNKERVISLLSVESAHSMLSIKAILVLNFFICDHV